MTVSMVNPPIKESKTAPPNDSVQPPATIEELSALLAAIVRGESSIVLGPKARTALGKIIDLRGNPALLSITALAEKVAINASTITRLARSLGYSGFSAFQEVLLAASLAPPGEFYLRQAQTALDSGDRPSKKQASQLCRESQANIDHFIEGFDTHSFDKAVELMAHSPRIAVHGIRQFHSFASFLVYGLRMIRSDVSLLDASTLGIAEELASLGEGDILISASCAPYSRVVADTAKAAAELGVTVIAITDRASSPLVDYSQTAVFAAHETSFLSNSMTTFILLAECLINGVAAAIPEEAKVALAQRDNMINRLEIERN